MRHAPLREQLGTQIAQHRVHLGHPVRDRRAGGEDHAAPAREFADVPGLHEHVEGAVAVGIGQPRDAAHLGGVEQVLVGVGLIHKKLVDAEFLEADGVVLALPVGALLELGGQALFGLLQFLDDAAVVALPFPGFVELAGERGLTASVHGAFKAYLCGAPDDADEASSGFDATGESSRRVRATEGGGGERQAQRLRCPKPLRTANRSGWRWL